MPKKKRERESHKGGGHGDLAQPEREHQGRASEEMWVLDLNRPFSLLLPFAEKVRVRTDPKESFFCNTSLRRSQTRHLDSFLLSLLTFFEVNIVVVVAGGRGSPLKSVTFDSFFEGDLGEKKGTGTHK